MNQELMTLDFWQDTVIYESKTFPVGTLACDALNVPVNTIAKINEQCEKINLLLGILNAGQDASALCPIATEFFPKYLPSRSYYSRSSDVQLDAYGQ